MQKSKCKNQNDNEKCKIIYKLLQAKDKNKDQSYFLWTLTQEQLKYCLFPIGDYLKSEVREIARKAGLSNADKKDSQGLCFVGKVKFRDFLNTLILKSDFKIKKTGLIKTAEGKIIGEHKGLEFYTIGQRQGIGLADGPYFVAEKNIKNNVLVVAKKNDPALYKKEVFVKNVNWITEDAGEINLLSLLRSLAPKYSNLRARIRYRQPLQDCRVYVISKNRFKVVFDKPARAVAPGQSIVFYSKQQVLGGGVIE